LWSAATGAHTATLAEHRLGVGGAVFSPDGSAVVTSSDDGAAIVWDVARRRIRVKLLGHRGGVYSAAFSPDGRRIATASEDRTAKIWDAHDGRTLATFEGNAAAVFGVAISPDAAHLATSGEDGFVRIWTISRLTQPWPALALDACTSLVGEAGRRFTDVEIQSDPLLRAEWPGSRRDVCAHVRGAK
jgi:WD40 repeat protein